LNSIREVEFRGVVAGFEESELGSPQVYVIGSVDGSEASFYLLVPREVFEKLVANGVGQYIEGRGVIVSENPLVIEYRGGIR